MRFLLDTCTIGDFVKGDVNTLTQVKNHSPYQLAISTITLMEIEYGLILNPMKAKQLRPIFTEFFSSISILAFQKAESDRAAQIRAKLKQTNTSIGAYDILIAATALSHNLTLITANTKEFARIEDLSLDNWTASNSRS